MCLFDRINQKALNFRFLNDFEFGIKSTKPKYQVCRNDLNFGWVNGMAGPV